MHPGSVESLADRLIGLTYGGTVKWVDDYRPLRGTISNIRNFRYNLDGTPIVFSGGISRVTDENHYFFLGDDGRLQCRAAMLSMERGMALINAIEAMPLAKRLEEELDKCAATLEDL